MVSVIIISSKAYGQHDNNVNIIKIMAKAYGQHDNNINIIIMSEAMREFINWKLH